MPEQQLTALLDTSRVHQPLPQSAPQHADPRYSQEGWLDKPATPPLWGLSAVVTSPALRRAHEPPANHQQVQPAGAKCPTKRRALDGTRQQTTARRHRGLLPAESARQESEEQASTSQLSPVAGTLCDSVSRLASASTGPDCRDRGRSVSDRRPESDTAALCPRPVQPGSGAGPRATITHRALSGQLLS